MTGHRFIPTQQVPRPRPPQLDPSLLSRALEKVGSDFPAVGAVLLAAVVAA